MTPKKHTIVDESEAFFNKYVTYPETHYSLPIALWAIGTHTWPTFDAYAYICVSGVTKRSGKTTLGNDCMSLIASNCESMSAQSASSIFRSITKEEKPTVIIDEAEKLNGEEASEMREVLNKGYRRGGGMTKVQNGKVVNFETYCPKLFILIGDVNDTLKDRSICFWMRRAEPASRFVYRLAKMEGDVLREKIHRQIVERQAEIEETYLEMSQKGLEFLTSRDEEIWLPLFTLCEVFAPERMEELTRAAVDLSSEKTADIRRFDSLRDMEKKAQRLEYAETLLRDVRKIVGENKAIPTAKLLDCLKEIPTAPWRKFKGVGLTSIEMASLLEIFGVKPKNVRFGKGANRNSSKGGAVAKGYTKESVEDGIKKLGKVDLDSVSLQPETWS